MMAVICPNCKKRNELNLSQWRCPDCENAWEPEPSKNLANEKILVDERHLWRYKSWMGNPVEKPVTLGAGGTSLSKVRFQGREVLFKNEFINPSGSFKDRGVEVMINVLHAMGAQRVIEDSSGNAGASLAAYAARLGIHAEIYIPENASPQKLAQIAMYGAEIKLIPGPRENATRQLQAAVLNGEVYASHAWHPAYLLGQQTAAWEVWEQLGHRAPDVWVTPVGQGGHFLGIWLGFLSLYESGLIKHIPRMVAVQAANMAPIDKMFNENLQTLPKMDLSHKTQADGVVVANPVRWQRILQVLHESDGFTVAVEEEDIQPARNELARLGFFVEPTSAVTTAALPSIIRQTGQRDVIVVSLTGSGLKVPI